MRPLQLPRQQKNLLTDHPDELGSVRHTTLETVREMMFFLKRKTVTLQTAYVGIISQPKQFAYETTRQLFSFHGVKWRETERENKWMNESDGEGQPDEKTDRKRSDGKVKRGKGISSKCKHSFVWNSQVQINQAINWRWMQVGGKLAEGR